MKYEIYETNKFKKDFEQIKKRKLDLNKFTEVLDLLSNGKTLPEKYKDHPLWNTKHFVNCRELHIEPDWILIYKYDNNNLVLILTRTGTHSDLF